MANPAVRTKVMRNWKVSKVENKKNPQQSLHILKYPRWYRTSPYWLEGYEVWSHPDVSTSPRNQQPDLFFICFPYIHACLLGLNKHPLQDQEKEIHPYPDTQAFLTGLG